MFLAAPDLALLLCLLGILAYGEQTYPLPNPFSLKKDGFYHIKSNQITVADSKNVDLLVEEYVSLSKGLTFSLHTYRNVKEGPDTFLLISDGLAGKTYIVRNPDHGSDHGIDCELDHVHSHRHIFPWQYEYNLPKSSDDKKLNKKDRKKKKADSDSVTVKSSVYGVAAIWLNAVSKSAAKELVDQAQSGFVRTWDMTGKHLNVQLNFEVASRGGEVDLAKIDTSRIRTINIDREYTISRENLKPARWQIIIDTFEAGVAESGNKLLNRYLQQLDECREMTLNHRVFPSLAKGINLSPDRAYNIEYILTRFSPLKEKYMNQFDPEKHRFLGQTEHVSEFLSYQKETQTIIYENDPDESKQPDIVHAYIRQFTARESGRSSRHAYQDYHIIEEKERVECKPNEHEQLPEKRFHLLTRPIYFHRDTGDIKLSGIMRGLGALLMNVAEYHYKHFELESYEDTFKDKEGKHEVIKSESWHIKDHANDLTYRFRFRVAQPGEVSEDITRLKFVTVSSSEGLLLSFKITKFDLEPEPDEQAFVFTPPSECYNDPSDIDKKHDEDIDPDSDYFYNDEFEDKFNNFDDYDNDDDSDSEIEENKDKFQQNGEEFELNPGDIMEINHVPSFYDFMETYHSYKITSRIQMDNDEGRMIFLQEIYSTKDQVLHLGVFKSEDDMALNRPLKEFFIDYKDEYIFSVDRDSRCELTDDVDPWLRLLSSHYTHYTRNKLVHNSKDNNVELVTSSSSKLRFYGVAALWQWATTDEFNAEFIGIKQPKRGQDGNMYREILWSLAEGGDTDIEYEFTFLFDETKSQESKRLKKHRSQGELTHLRSIKTVAPAYWDEREYKFVDSKFVMAKIDLKDLLCHNKLEVNLPQSCSRARARADVDKKKREYDLVKYAQVPSLTDELRQKNARSYHLKYTVEIFGSGRVEQIEYHEQVNLDTDKGYIMERRGISGPGADYYIDLAKQETFQDDLSSGRDRSSCRKVDEFKLTRSFESLLSPYISLDGNGKLFGLSALWNRLSHLGHLKMDQKMRHGDRGGRYYEDRTYTTTLVNSGGSSDHLDIILRFTSNLQSLHHEDHQIGFNTPLDLTKIEFFSRSKGRGLREPVAQIFVYGLFCPGKVPEIPQYCLDGSKTAAPDRKDSEPQPNSEPDSKIPFPKIEEYIKENLFHMKSEVEVSKNGVKIPSSFLLDEWVKRGTVRVKSKKLGNDIDLIVFEETNEIFDISKPYECGRSQPRLPFLTLMDHDVNLFDFWAGRARSVSDPVSLYYGPLALWLLAERSDKSVKVMQIGPSTDTGNKQLDSSPHEISTETWLVSGSKSPHSLSQWSYVLEFDKVSMKGEVIGSGTKEWHLLNSITVNSVDSRGDNWKITIDVINYKFRHTEAETIDLFKLPDGYGCYRGSSDEHDERFKVTDLIDKEALLVGGRVSFEATMEHQPPPFRDSYKPRAITPTVSGSLVMLPHGEGPGIQGLYSRLRRLDGSFEATKKVYDPATSLLHVIDRSSGYCKIQLIDDYLPRIEFAMAAYQTEAIYLGDYELNILLGDAAKYRKVNDYTVEGIHYVTYEAKTDRLYMGTTRQETKATIVRTFAYKDSDLGSKIHVRDGVAMHQSVDTKVIILEPRTNHNLKTLSISFNLKVTSDSYNLPNILRELSVVQCYNDGDSLWKYTSEQFTMEYQLNTFQYLASIMHPRRLESSLYASLIANTDVHPLQLDGEMHVEYAPDYLARYNFNLLAPATAYLRFKEMVERKMGRESEDVAETRLVSSIVKCSKWCDEQDCITMSYCSDMTCRIIPSRHTLSKHVKLDFRNDFTVDTRCSFYKGPVKNPPSLRSFEQSMSMIINEERNKHELDKFALKDFFDIVPTKFFGSRKKFDFVDEDIDDYDSTRQNQIVLQTVPGQLKLDAAQLSRFNDGRKNQVQSTPSHQKTYGDCLNQCKDDCVAISYCKDNSECQVLTGRADVKKMIDAIGDPIKDCQAALRDYTLEFDRIQNVTMPTKYNKRLNEYSTVECAAACKDDEDCLSFESCALTMDRNLNLPNQVCLLQKSHMAQESIFSDRSADPDAVFFSCDHFSRAVIYDYLKIPDSRLKAKPRGVVRGLNVDKCALDCETDEECRAFEYCYDLKKRPTQSCYFVKSPDVLDTSSMSKSSLTSQLKSSKFCSVYVLNGERANPMIEVVSRSSSFFVSMLKIVLYVMGSISIGYLIQMLSIRYTGRSVLF